MKISLDRSTSFLDKTSYLAIDLSAKFWFLVALTGQWIFVFYILALYGVHTVNGDIDAFNQVLPKGYVEGDFIGNAIVVVHMFFAVIVMGLGPLQFVPGIRNRFPKFHRWNGRTYLCSVCLASLGGLIMIWTRGTVGGIPQHTAMSIISILILVFAFLTIRYALKRRFDIHRLWAFRLFLVASAVWFYRLGLMFWIGINGGPVGFDMKTFEGPFLTFLAFAQFLLPLAMLELYFYAKSKHSGIYSRLAISTLLFSLTICMGVGLTFATLGLWLPRI